MSLVATDAVVLHAADYLESSRILRLATRAQGVVSVLAKGARRSQRRFGSALDLFAGGDAHYYAKAGRDLHTLASFEVTRSRLAIGLDLDRFAAAAAIAELVLRFGRDEAEPAWFEALVTALDRVAAAPPEGASAAGLAGTWHLLAVLGFAPALDVCASCHDAIGPDTVARFSHPTGGALCANCGRRATGSRTLPPDARAALRNWVEGASDGVTALDAATARAHLRLLREFVREHLADGRPLRAFEAWEGERWRAPA